jgi:hypothetical protein
MKNILKCSTFLLINSKIRKLADSPKPDIVHETESVSDGEKK